MNDILQVAWSLLKKASLFIANEVSAIEFEEKAVDIGGVWKLSNNTGSITITGTYYLHLDMYTETNSENTTLACRVNGKPMFKAIFSPIVSNAMTRGHAAILTLKSGDAITVTLNAGSLYGFITSFSSFYGFLLAPN